MGEARQRILRVGLPPGAVQPNAPVFIEETIYFAKDSYLYLKQLMDELNEELRKAGKPLVPDLRTFIAKGIIPQGIQEFKQAQAEYLKDKRLIVLPHEVGR